MPPSGLAFRGWVARGADRLGGCSRVPVRSWFEQDLRHRNAGARLTLLFGVGLIVLAVKKWRSRPPDGEEPELPGWMASINDIQPNKAAVLGLTLAGVNPKNIAILFAVSTVIVEADLSVAATAFEAFVFVLLSSVVVLGAVAVYLVGGSRAATALHSLETFMLQNNAVIMMIILLIFGIKLIGDGLAGI